MNRYNIRIDGEVMPNSYTYEELLLNDILDFDDIEVKHESKSNWTNIKSFYFPEEHDEATSANDNFYVGEDGQVHFKEQKEYAIDEFGQVVSQNNIGGGSNSTLTSENSTQETPSRSSSTSSSSDNTGWKVFFTIVAIVIFIVITCTTGWGSIPAGIVGYWTLKTIWGDDL